MEEAQGGPGPGPGVGIIVAPSDLRPRISTRQSVRRMQKQTLVNLLKHLQGSYEAASSIIEQILDARSTYIDLYSQKYKYLRSLHRIVKQLQAFNDAKALPSTLKSAKSRQCSMSKPKIRRHGYARSRKLLKGVTKFRRSLLSLSGKLDIAYRRLEHISQRFLESRNLLGDIHRSLDTITLEEMPAARDRVPDFLWVKNNLFPDHVYLKTDWNNQELNKGLKNLQSQFKILKNTDFKKERKGSIGAESTSGSEVSDVEVEYD